MKIARRNRIAELRKQAGLTQQQLAEAVGSHWVTISRLERGIVRLTYEWAERLSTPLRVEISELILPDREIGQARVVGSVGRNGLVTKLNDEDIYFRSAMRSIFTGPNTEWLEVEGFGKSTLIRDGDILKIDHLGEEDMELLDELDGRLCVVQLETDEVYLTILGMTKEKDKFDLLMLSGPPIKSVPLKSIAKVGAAFFWSDMDFE